MIDHARVVVIAAVDKRGPNGVEQPLGRCLVQFVLIVFARACEEGEN